MSTVEDTPREFAEIEADIARTRASLNRKIQELEKRLSPSERVAEVKRRLDPRRLDPRPYPEWMAVGAIALGACLAITGWRRSRVRVADDTDLEDVIVFEVCEEIAMAEPRID